MFDIGFPELLLISVVALLVIGPDKLPETIRAMSLWLGRFRRSFEKIKREIENEIGADEIKAQLYNESIMQDLEKSKKALTEVKDNVTGVLNEVDKSVSDLKTTSIQASTEPLSEPSSEPLESKPMQIQE